MSARIEAQRKGVNVTASMREVHSIWQSPALQWQPQDMDDASLVTAAAPPELLTACDEIVLLRQEILAQRWLLLAVALLALGTLGKLAGVLLVVYAMWISPRKLWLGQREPRVTRSDSIKSGPSPLSSPVRSVTI